jgi:hypothetical protein
VVDLAIPDDIIGSVIPLLLKKPHLDPRVSSNYRAIANSPSVSKIIEILFANRLKPFLHTSDFQFGFKSGSDTNTATTVLRSIISLYNECDTPVYCSFLDAFGAFDNAEQSAISKCLIRRDVPLTYVDFISEWYRKQQSCVRWNGSVSQLFNVQRGVRQGGILSPGLFNLVIDEIIEFVNKYPYGVMIDGYRVNIIAYADDIVLISTSLSSLQRLVDLCVAKALEAGLRFNPDKCAVVCFTGKTLAPVYEDMEPIMINNGPVPFTSEFNYLGHTLCSSNRDDLDINRLRRSFFGAYYGALRPVSTASVQVKKTIFQAHCLHLFGSESWFKFPQYKFCSTAVNTGIKRVLGASKFDSTTLSLSESNLLPFEFLWKQRKILFYKRLLLCAQTNQLVNKCVLLNPFVRHLNEILKEFDLLKVNLLDLTKQNIQHVVRSAFHRKVIRKKAEYENLNVVNVPD